MSASGPNSLNGALNNPGLLAALYPNLNLPSLAQLYQSEQAAMEAPLQQMTAQLQAITAQSSAWQAIGAQVTTLAQDFNNLSLATTWQSPAAASSSPTVLTATAGSSAAPGTYVVNVSQVGQPEIVVGQTVESSATAQLNLSAQTVTINSQQIGITATDSLNSIAQKINAANAGVSAAVIDSNGSYQLSLTSTQDQAITGSGTDLFGTTSQGLALNLSSPFQAAKPWNYQINGVSESSTTSTDSQSIPGVTLSLVGLGSSTVTVTSSDSGVTSALSSIAKDYNALESAIGKYTAKGAPLAGDPTAEGLLGQVNQLLFSYNTSLPVGYQSVTDAGLSLTLNPDKTTTLTFNSTAFQSAYTANPGAIQELLAGGASGGGGIGSQLHALLNTIGQPGGGIIANLLNGFQQQIQSVKTAEQNEQALITMQQSALASRFNQEMNMLIGLMGQKSMLDGLLNQLGGSGSQGSSSKPGG